MNQNPLSTYVKLTRLVFNVEPSERWDGCEEFEEDLRELYEKILCKICRKLLVDPVVPKKNHFSCQHRVCLDCIGKKRPTPTNCHMCSDYTIFEKSHAEKLLLRCFQDLCELVHTSWIYDFIQRRTNHDTGQSETPSLLEIIDAGMNYGAVVLEDSSSDENSSSSDSSKEQIFTPQIFPQISPLPLAQAVVSPPPPPHHEQFTIISDPVIPIAAAPIAPLPPPTQPVPQVVQYQPQIVQSQLPSTSKLTPNNFIRYPPPMRIAAPVNFSSPPTPTIYSVMYTGSGNKITLKRKPPDDVGAVAPVAPGNNVSAFKSSSLPAFMSAFQMTILKTENVMNSNFKRPPIQQPPPQQQPTNVITAPTSSNPNDPQKRRGCRCGNATAAPGKLTCCGQRCPCYVDSKACIDCKCKGCRNPHYVDGHKKVSWKGFVSKYRS
jgi:male-specific lethal 2